MKKSFTIATLLLASVLTASAQGTAQERVWTLSQCIEYALSHNLSVKQSELTVQMRRIELDDARSSYLPAAALSNSQNFSFGRGLTADNTYSNTNTTTTSLSLGGELPLFEGFRKKNNVICSRLNLSAATEDLEKIKDDIRTSVAAAYVQILYDREILSVALEQVVTDSLQCVRMEAVYDEGKAGAAEVAQQRATLAQSRLAAVQARGELQMSLLAMTQLLELDSPDGFDVDNPSAGTSDGELPSPDDIYAVAVGIRPVILSEQLRLDAAEAGIRAARAGYSPTLSLSGGLGTNYYTASGMTSARFFEQIGNNFSQYIGLSLSIPVFSRFSTRNSVQTAKITWDNQRLQLENTQKSLYKEIQQAYWNAVTSRAKYESSVEAEASARAAYDLTRARYENGKADITEFNASRTQWLEAESDLLKSRYESLYQTNILYFYQGEEIAL